MDNIKSLGDILDENVGLSKPRKVCLSVMVASIIMICSVNLKRVCQSSACVGVASSGLIRLVNKK